MGLSITLVSSQNNKQYPQMKKVTLLFFMFVAVMMASNSVMAQKQNVIKLNPLSLALGNISVSYERFLSEKTSLQLHGAYWLGGSIGDTKWNGMTVTPEFRYYVSDNERPKGFYLAPFGKYQSFTAKSKEADYKASINRIGGGAAFGYQFLFGSVTWDTFLGPQYLSNTVKYSGEGSQDQVNIDRFAGNFGLRFGTTIGIAF
jgi:hypothetical protein